MPRLNPIPYEDLPKDIQERLDSVFGPQHDKGTTTGTPGNWWNVWGRVPEILPAFSAYSYRNAPVDSKILELALVRTGYARASQFVFSQHCKAARREGVEEAKIAAVPYWTISDVFSDKERAVLAYVDGQILEGGRVHHRVFEALKKHFSDEEILVLTYHINMYQLHAVTTKALRLEYDDVPDRIVEIPAPETRKVQDWLDPSWSRAQG